MNPKQLRGVITLIIAAVGAIAVFLMLVSYVSSVRAEVGPTTEVYKTTEDVAVYQPIDFETLETEEIPDKYLTAQMITSQEQIAGQKAVAAISAGSLLQVDMLTPASSLADGEREISVNFDGDLGINGRVQPGDVVDVIASFARAREDVPEQSYRRAEIPYNVAGVLVDQARVLAVGQPVDAGAAQGSAAEGGQGDTVVPVTFAVTMADANRLAYGESFAVSMRIVRSGNNETGNEIDDDDKSFQDPDLGDNFSGIGEDDEEQP